LSIPKGAKINPLTPVPAVTSLGLSSTSDVTNFDSTAEGGNDISSDTQIRVIGPMELEMCPKMLKKLSENSKQN